MPEAAMPHCDSAVLHAPGECEYCDAYPSWQEARRMWGIAFTGHPPEEGEFPCPSTIRRDLSTINEWPGNRPSPPSARYEEPSVEDFPAPVTTPTITYTQGQVTFADGHVGPLSDLGRSSVPTTRRDLEEWVRKIVEDILREERNR